MIANTDQTQTVATRNVYNQQNNYERGKYEERGEKKEAKRYHNDALVFFGQRGFQGQRQEIPHAAQRQHEARKVEKECDIAPRLPQVVEQESAAQARKLHEQRVGDARKGSIAQGTHHTHHQSTGERPMNQTSRRERTIQVVVHQRNRATPQTVVVV
jgi:hypothetical protein